jgi:hypothetical protein
MRYIYLNGCSFVVGLGVEKEKTIIDIISKKLNCEYFNDSRDGASNDYIKRTTMTWLLENEDKWSDLLVLIGWSEFTRFELFNSATNEYMDSALERIYYGRLNRKYWKIYMKFFYDLEDRFRIYLDNILYVQLFLESNNIKYVFWDSIWSLLAKPTEKFRIDYRHRFNKINLKNWVIGEDYISWADHLDKIDPKNEKTRLSLKDDHPNKYGHEVWAEKILEKINEVIHT